MVLQARTVDPLVRFGSTRHFSTKRIRRLRAASKSTNAEPTRVGTCAQAPAANPMSASGPLAWYSRKLETHPFTTKCLTSGVIAGSGDALCQYLVHQNEADFGEAGSLEERYFRLDRHRTGRFVILGAFLVGPVVHLWYGRLATLVPGSSARQVMTRTFLDQACFAPLFLPTFMTNLMLLEGRPFAEVPGKIERDLPGALVTNWFLWIPAQMVNFGFVPLKYQVLFSNMTGFIWNTYLSWKTQDSDSGKAEVETVAESRM
eukprot:CAMPEP_0183309458 /NCGR_PEP_ID=MMETSP0160_2-20130417/25355_1 /TAXON_ID=2839 ORGANISM="Odontella Sinensis, Strain Grunow 1884" /NCGR_SAMPLE_ID=MMETSP0160_2 /ASSEMBLY_ACC=CAM_ASM_000250 /LENGTH=259 /DNA_ID=CAMNT_0025473487 /DNA_START=47 /DNA_END=826 /DNA_ORIENTATION=-